MTDSNDLELDLDLETEEPNLNRTEERIRNLSSKVKANAQEAATEREAHAAAEARADAAEKKAEFLDSFTGLTSKYPNATEHRDAILEKVQAGYTVEDATVSVLNAEGKLMPQAEIASGESPLGGSAAISGLGGQKSVGEMTREEKRAALMEADSRGEIAEALRRF